MTLSDGKHEQNPRVVITILHDNNDNAGDPHYGGLLRCYCIIEPSTSHYQPNTEVRILSFYVSLQWEGGTTPVVILVYKSY